MQDAKSLVSSLPIFEQKFIQGVTDIGGFFNHVFYGAGLMAKYKVKNNKFGGSLMSV